jgi:EXPERA (EXPanded EBP superfamily)
MRALTGATRVVFLSFFASHIFATVIIDGQAVLPSSIFPLALQDLLTWYARTMKDPLMSNSQEILWFQSLVCCELLFQLPFFFWACYMLSSSSSSTAKLKYYPESFKSACIAYGAHTATTMVPILATIVANEEASAAERAMLSSVYLPYLIFPLALLGMAVQSPSETDSAAATKKNR